MDSQFGHHGSIDDQADTSDLSFPQFPKLPPELRLKVWKLASFHTRNIPVNVHHQAIPGRDNYGRTTYKFTSSCLPPAILHCTQESRNEALKSYTLSFGKSWMFSAIQEYDPDFGAWEAIPEVEVVQKPTIYVNWKADRLCVMEPRHFLGEGNDIETETPDKEFLKICKRMNGGRLAFNMNKSGDMDRQCAEFAFACAKAAKSLILVDCSPGSVYFHLQNVRLMGLRHTLRFLRFDEASPEASDTRVRSREAVVRPKTKPLCADHLKLYAAKDVLESRYQHMVLMRSKHDGATTSTIQAGKLSKSYQSTSDEMIKEFEERIQLRRVETTAALRPA